MTAARKRKPQVEAIDYGTKERRAKGDVIVNDTPSRTERRGAVVCPPLDRLRNSGRIDDALHRAGEKYLEHRYNAGQSGVARTANLQGVGGGGDCNYGMAATEWQAHHLQEFRKAVQALGKWNSVAFEMFIIDECSLETVGRFMGERDKKVQIATARTMVEAKLARLADLWGLTGAAKSA
jgi:hypothetical protein